MAEYVTTNIRLPRELHRQLKRRALDEDKSLAELVRESIVQYLTPESVAPQPELPGGMTLEAWNTDPLWAIGSEAGMADVTDGSVNHDVYLYGPLSAPARTELGDD
jgi:hypothetical protein